MINYAEFFFNLSKTAGLNLNCLRKKKKFSESELSRLLNLQRKFNYFLMQKIIIFNLTESVHFIFEK